MLEHIANALVAILLLLVFLAALEHQLQLHLDCLKIAHLVHFLLEAREQQAAHLHDALQMEPLHLEELHLELLLIALAETLVLVVNPLALQLGYFCAVLFLGVDLDQTPLPERQLEHLRTAL
jgi:hypothetical protein